MEFITLLVTGIAGLFLLLILTVLVFLVYCGLLHDIMVTTTKPPIGQFTVVYKFGRGPYKNCCETFSEATSLNQNLKCFGIYYDDPKKIPAENLRWAVGCVIAEDGDMPDVAIVAIYEENGYKVFSFPATEYAVVSSFPYVAGISISLANFKVYPAISAYVKEKNLCAHPWLEIYCEGKIWYMAMLSRQTEFYVPEVGIPNQHSM